MNSTQNPNDPQSTSSLGGRFGGAVRAVATDTAAKTIAAVLVAAFVGVATLIGSCDRGRPVSLVDDSGRTVNVHRDVECVIESPDTSERVSLDRDSRVFACKSGAFRHGSEVRLLIGSYRADTKIVLDEHLGLVVRLDTSLEALSRALSGAKPPGP